MELTMTHMTNECVQRPVLFSSRSVCIYASSHHGTWGCRITFNSHLASSTRGFGFLFGRCRAKAAKRDADKKREEKRRGHAGRGQPAWLLWQQDLSPHQMLPGWKEKRNEIRGLPAMTVWWKCQRDLCLQPAFHKSVCKSFRRTQGTVNERAQWAVLEFYRAHLLAPYFEDRYVFQHDSF